MSNVKCKVIVNPLFISPTIIKYHEFAIRDIKDINFINKKSIIYEILFPIDNPRATERTILLLDKYINIPATIFKYNLFIYNMIYTIFKTIDNVTNIGLSKKYLYIINKLNMNILIFSNLYI